MNNPREQIGIPKQWMTWKPSVKEEEKTPQDLIDTEIKRVKDKITDRDLKEPFFFKRDLGKVQDFVDKEIKDRSKMGLTEKLVKLFNGVSGKDSKLSAEEQKSIIDSVEKLEDNKDKNGDSVKSVLLNMLSKLFTESYDRRRASLVETLRKIAKLLSV